MTQLYKKNGTVFILAGITVEEIENLKDDNKVMADNYVKMEQKFYDNFTKAKEIIRDLLHVLPKENIEGIYEITEEAEHFISEVLDDR